MMKRPKVVIGMSGGVDSSAAAAILVDQGYEVHGITLKVWEEEENPNRRWQERSCCKVGLARYVAERLGIPHRVVDTRETFRRVVVDDFISGYLRGDTPNPCVRCNERIKFGLLYDLAMDLGADFLATGHYVRLKQGESGQYQLMQGIDELKDQSYFLYRLRPEILPRLIFPLGSYRKTEVLKWIERLDLPPEEVQESQEICFVTQGDYRKFLSQESPEADRPGDFVRSNGDVLGRHHGVAFYTVGQRRGLGLSSSKPGERLYVLSVDPKADSVVIGTEDELYCEGLIARDLNWFGPLEPSGSLEIKAKIRYRSPKVTVTLECIDPGHVKIAFQEPQRSVTPGQSVVFYDGEVVLGGGIIDSVRRIQVQKAAGVFKRDGASRGTSSVPAQQER